MTHVPAAPLASVLPVGRTAQRLQWSHLPPGLRRAVEDRLGSPVTDATSQDAGYTPGMAAVLTCADGSRHFVKAASTAAQRQFAAAYREEARKLAALPADVPAPPLRWVLDAGGWVVLCTAYVAGRAPARPWREAELEALLAALEAVATACTPAPSEVGTTFAEELGALPGHWDHVRAHPSGLTAAEVDEGARLAALALQVTAGETLVHTDVRDDNVLLRGDGTAVLCDWNWPVRGAAWVDTVTALVGPRGDGLDVEAVLAASALTRDVPAEHVDALLALLLGYFWHAADQPVPPTSPHLRPFQAWQRDVVLDWLRERRGWA